ncbi:hypothetical protein TWF506_004436 [Arthrobotrys conoides]|uniref:Peptidase S8/S53 domain-containing protein n=1 Tax=Arthrobotrys conoides TaxID=74498 RepID=A0AAN8MWY4_9PEZI
MDSALRIGWIEINIFIADPAAGATPVMQNFAKKHMNRFKDKIWAVRAVYSSVKDPFKEGFGPWRGTPVQQQVKRSRSLGQPLNIRQSVNSTSMKPRKTKRTKREVVADRAHWSITKRDFEWLRGEVRYALPDLQVISQRPESKIAPKKLPIVGDYYQFKTQLSGQVIYLVDTGFDLTHPEFKDAKIQDWIFPGSFPADEKSDDFSYHGTTVGSKIVGKFSGVAPGAELIIVRYNDGRGIFSAVQASGLLVRIREHIETYNSKRDCIINMSISWFLTDDNYQKIVLASFLNWAKKRGVIIVTAAGNGNPNEKISGWPQGLLHEDFYRNRYENTLVVVGGMDIKRGSGPIFQSAPFVKVSAPATGVFAAGPTRDPYGQPLASPRSLSLAPRYIRTLGLQPVSGTSFAAPMVAGMIAIWLGTGIFTSDNVVKGMYDLAYNRTEKGPNVLYNGFFDYMP